MPFAKMYSRGRRNRSLHGSNTSEPGLFVMQSSFGAFRLSLISKHWEICLEFRYFSTLGWMNTQSWYSVFRKVFEPLVASVTSVRLCLDCSLMFRLNSPRSFAFLARSFSNPLIQDLLILRGSSKSFWMRFEPCPRMVILKGVYIDTWGSMSASRGSTIRKSLITAVLEHNDYLFTRVGFLGRKKISILEWSTKFENLMNVVQFCPIRACACVPCVGENASNPNFY